MARNRRPKFVIGWIPLLISFVRVSALSLVVFGAMAQLYGQTKVLTYHNDDARTGQNLTETILTPANVDSNHFGKLHSVTVDGYVHAQPLVATNIDIPGQGTHNVVYVATENDSLYAIDADDGSVLWHVSFIDPSAGVTTLSSSVCSASPPQIGISGTPVIDASTGTIYLVALTQENGTYIQRLHAIDLATHAEKFGGPVVIQASASGIGSGSVNGTINFDPRYSNQRGGLLLRNGHVIIAWAAFCDASLWHGWVMSYDAGTLSQEAVLNLSPSGTAAGVWMGGGGLAADADSNFYFATGNGDFDGISNFGNSILKITGPSNGSFALQDWFTPYDQATLNGKDSDLGAGGVLLLPDLPPGFAHPQVLVQAGKTGTIYVLDRNNMGKYCSTCTTSNTQILQEIVKANPGMRGLPAYWNGNLYIGGGHTDYMKAFSFNANNDGLLSTSPSSKTPELFSYPGPTPSVSANGKTSGILWALENGTYASSCCQVLRAYDATNLANELYNTSQAPNGRDVPGAAVKFTVPTVANGKVYVGSQASLSIYGLLPTAATPEFSPAAGTYSSPQSVTLSDNSAGTNIYFTTDGSAPTSSSTVYTSPLSVSTTTTIKAMAAAAALSPSAVGSATYTIQQAAATPVFSPAAGTYTSAQSVTLSDNSAGTTIYYTINGVTPTTSSPVYSAPIAVSTTTTIKAMAAGGAFTASAVGSATYTIQRAAATPVFSPVAGTYTSAQSVTLSDSSAGTTIYYTLNGTTPTTSSTVYSAPIAVSTTTTIKAIATGGAFTASAVGSATYTIQQAAASPVFSPAAGTYHTAQSVSISDSSPGVTIHYTTNGTTPTASSTLYTGPIAVKTTTTIKAIAVGAGFAASAVGTATYTLTAATPVFSPIAGTYHTAQSVSISDSSPGVTIHYTTNGTTPTASSTVYTGPIVVKTTTTIKAMAEGGGFAAGAVRTAIYTLTAATPVFSPVAGTYHAAQSVSISDSSLGVTIHYTTNGTTPTTASTVYTGRIAVKTTTTIKAIAVGGGFAASAVGTATYTLTAATPFFSPVAATYHTAQSVTIADTSPGVAIHYTTNGTTPTTASTVYTAPIAVKTTTTIKAVAVGGGFAASAVRTAIYTLTAATPVFNPVAGTYHVAQSVSISDSSPGVTIHYTTNGTTPTTSSTVYTGRLAVKTTTTIKAMAAGAGFAAGAVASATYTIQ